MIRQKQSQKFLSYTYYYANNRLSYNMAPLAEMDNIEVDAGVKGKSRISFWSF